MSGVDYLFNEGDLSGALRAQEQRLEQAAQTTPPDHALAHSAEELAAELIDPTRRGP